MSERSALHDIDSGAVEALAQGRLADPFAVLGPHEDGAGTVVRAFLPGAVSVRACARGSDEVLAELQPVHAAGLFAGRLSRRAPYVLRIEWPAAIEETEDPYAFGLLLGELDLHLLAEGTHRELAACLGAHPLSVEGVPGIRFAVWAPNASRVSVIGDFNAWDSRRHPMRRRHGAGVWELFVPRLLPGARYKYAVAGPDGWPLPDKADPVARATEPPPATASVVAPADRFRWSDSAWCGLRQQGAGREGPLSIYEVHAGSWFREADGETLSWDALGDRLVPYVADLGFTHVEFLPVMEHPFAGSWGYQPLGLFAPSARFGPPEGFARLVDRFHAAGIGVILDWVPAHFPNDAHGLAHFDGTALYEHQDPREGVHRDWNTLIYNVGRNEVRGFLIASALHWLERYHVDGLRVDAVASMLYRDYSRREGEWIPNRYGGRENIEAIEFFRELSRVVTARCPGTLLIAEESTAWPGVTADPGQGGLGFTHKWNMGWMHDTLRYMAHEPIHRAYHHDDMSFGLVYAFSERFVLPLSHDEVVYGKGSLLGRMPGDDWQRFANLRAYLAFMWGHPGKKLLFMGGEFAQEREWNHDAALDWHLLDRPAHRGVQSLVRDLNRLHRAAGALHRRDFDPAGFRWIVGDDRAQSVFAFLRQGDAEDRPVLVVCNFTPVPRHAYAVGVPRPGIWREILNTDAAAYGGSNLGNDGLAVAAAEPSHGMPASLRLVVPPLATVMLQYEE